MDKLANNADGLIRFVNELGYKLLPSQELVLRQLWERKLNNLIPLFPRGSAINDVLLYYFLLRIY